jgi:hypothetical protein
MYSTSYAQTTHNNLDLFNFLVLQRWDSVPLAKRENALVISGGTAYYWRQMAPLTHTHAHGMHKKKKFEPFHNTLNPFHVLTK